MTFLYDDEILNEFLINSGLVSQLNKKAQQTAADLNKFVGQLVDTLQTQLSGQDENIYVKNVTDLNAYVNFLFTSEKRGANGKLLVLRGVPNTKDAQLYTALSGDNEGFWALANDLKDNLAQLDQATQNNNLAKPFIADLISEFNTEFKDKNLSVNPSQPTDGAPTLPSLPNDGSSSSGTPAQPGNSATNPNGLQNISLTQIDAAKQQAEQIFQYAPFANNVLHPEDIFKFVIGMSTLYGIITKTDVKEVESDEIGKPKPLPAGTDPDLAQLLLSNRSIRQVFADWQRFIDKLSTDRDRDNNPVAPGVEMYKNREAFTKSTTVTDASHMYGSLSNAKQAATKLISMIRVVENLTTTIQHSTKFQQIINDTQLQTLIANSRQFKSKLETLIG